eukprot:7736836-Heterocapsa_arctica.AAC.1
MEVASVAEGGAPVVHARFGSARTMGATDKASKSVDEFKAAFGEPSSEGIASLYSAFAEKGLSYGPTFQGLKSFAFSDSGAVALLGQDVPAWERSLQLLHPALLDSAMQLLVETASRKAGGKDTYLPFAIRRA